MNLSTLHAPKRSSENRKRVGRGMGSGMGKTSTRGHKGQGSRSGSRLLRGFEGGQMPLHRRLPKRGFFNIFREEYAIVNLSQIAGLGETNVTPDLLRTRGLISGKNKRVKVLGDGDLKSALTVHAHKFSKSAEEKIKTAGGAVTVIEIKEPAPVKNRFEAARAQKRAGKQKKQA